MDISIKSSAPLVTALICNYNYCKYLPDAIESVLAQSWKNIEIIVVDDGSTDASREVLKRYEGHLRAILKENGGQASAFNEGIAEAHGEILCFLDSDDIWHPDKVAEVVAKYREAAWGLVCHGYELIDATGTILPEAGYQMDKTSLLGGDMFHYQQEHGYPWVFSPTSGMSMPSIIAHQLNPIPETDFRISADIALAYGSICFGPVGIIDRALFNYRIHGANGFALLQNQPRKLDVVNLIDSVKKFLYMKSVADGRSLDISVSLNDYYYFYRKAVFIAKKQPYKYIYRLWSLNMRQCFGKGQNVLSSLYDFTR
jgi:glycosyltransferase involved in cell wall biosynthesis